MIKSSGFHRDYLGLYWVGVTNSQGPYKGDAGQVSQRESHVMTEAEIRICYSAGFEDGGRDHEPKNAMNAV